MRFLYQGKLAIGCNNVLHALEAKYGNRIWAAPLVKLEMWYPALSVPSYFKMGAWWKMMMPGIVVVEDV